MAFRNVMTTAEQFYTILLVTIKSAPVYYFPDVGFLVKGNILKLQ